jgi:hypothetical protein
LCLLRGTHQRKNRNSQRDRDRASHRHERLNVRRGTA